MIQVEDWGLTDYEEALQRQRDIFHSMVERKKRKEKISDESLILTEHLPVLTLGKHAKKENIKLPYSILEQLGIKVIQIERGGDVTCHEPGQLTVYPLLDLEKYGIGVKDYVNILEESVIKTLNEWKIKGERLDGAPGVWIKRGTDVKKICAIGIKCSRFCSMHGIALNVNNSLETFNYINPCGFSDYGVTSMKNETGERLDISKVKSVFSSFFMSLIFSFKK